MSKSLISHNIQMLIDSERMTQAEFAKKFGQRRGYIESLIAKTGRLNVEFTDRINKYFGISIGQLSGQKLTMEDLTHKTGHLKSIAEVRLEEAYARITILEKMVEDKDKIIRLLEDKSGIK